MTKTEAAIKILQGYKRNGRKLITVDFMLELLQGSYTGFKTTDEGNVIPTTKTPQKGA